ncbi:hypothetical protein GALMADRAFT_145602 [Galerina marginata CBS 339.88]|uniref:Uncharacterized protein n=1 Tax=Galerina marginata (strain CBS 339.88) TaxID=685588 RepID=A0A067SE21_GALM3|nr:hypothetical protein GALMADRAFT_145602 [Galerina marginata CBS 339.88]
MSNVAAVRAYPRNSCRLHLWISLPPSLVGLAPAIGLVGFHLTLYHYQLPLRPQVDLELDPANTVAVVVLESIAAASATAVTVFQAIGVVAQAIYHTVWEKFSPAL